MGSEENVDIPFQNRKEGIFPFEFFVDFLEFLDRNKDLVEVITYDDLDWGNDFDYMKNYQAEKSRWDEALKSGKRDRGKVYLFLQHDVDSHPERTMSVMREEEKYGIRSNVMIFNQRVDRQKLAKEGELSIRDYVLDVDLMKRLEKKGFVIGYHCNAMERAGFDHAKALRVFVEDYHELSRNFNIKYFSPHGGVRGPSGESNAAIEIPDSLRTTIRWVNNRQTVKINGNYSDGGITGSRLKAEERDPREFIKSWRRGGRYRILFHPQYFHTPYSEAKILGRTEWYREIFSLYGKGASSGEVWPDHLLSIARSELDLFSGGKVVKAVKKTSAVKKSGWRWWPFRQKDDIDFLATIERRPVNPIIIGGDGRSGTTLLSVILDSHPRLAVGPELHFNGPNIPNLGPYIEHCFELMSKGKTHEMKQSEELKPGLQFINRCERAGIPPKILAELIKKAKSETASDLSEFKDKCALVRMLGEYNCFKNKAGRWGFKIMREIKNISKYGEVWPDASYVHIIRDGRDVATSQIKEHGSWGYGGIEKAAQGWAGVIEGARKTAKGLKYREVRYEDLVLKTEETLKSLVSWLGEEWDDALLSHHQNSHSLFETRVAHPSRKQVEQPINNSAVGRFRADLSKDEIQEFESIAGYLLKDLGYEL